MSEPSKTPPKKTKELPDKEAIRKLFPEKVVKDIEKEIEQNNRSKPSKKQA